MGTSRQRFRSFRTYAPGNRETGYYSGGSWVHLLNSAGSSLENIDESCDDTIGPYPFVEPHDLSLIKRDCDPLLVSGEARTGSFQWQRYASYAPQNWSGAQYVTAPPSSDINWWKAKALAALNPYRPEVDLPLFLFEFREFPRMLRDLGRVLSGGIKPKDAPGGYLAYNFGWAPLLGDLQKLINLGESLQRTRKRLQDAANGRRIRRSLGTIHSPGLPWVYTFVTGQYGSYQLLVTRDDSIKGWCTAKVYLNDPLPDGPGLDWEVLRTTLNLRVSASTIWESIPWSFLIDYFVNIGDLVEARQGYNRWRFSNMFLMLTSSRLERVASTITQLGGLSYTGGRRVYTAKTRSYMGSDPSVSFALTPMLSGYQLGIIGALATASALRR
jgi:hypothetical protein